MKLTIKKFMWFDIIILSIIGIFMDIVAFYTISRPSSPEYIGLTMYVAPSIVIIYLTYIRWGKYGLFTNLVVLLVNMFLYKEQLFQNMTYLVIFISGYITWMLTLLVRKIYKTGKYSTWYIVPFVFIGIYLVQILIESLISHLVGTPISLESNFLKHMVNMIVTFIVMVIIALQNKLTIDMKYHLENKEDEVEKW